MSRARSITHRWHAPDPDEDRLTARVEYEIDDELQRLHDQGVVYEYDTGRGQCIWFEVCPGSEARRIRDWVRARLPDKWKVGEW